MKKKILLLISIITFTTGIAQTNFQNGFETGYKKGYCQDQGINCLPPIPPTPPLPTLDEEDSSYNDGYNRGFQMGLQARKNNSSTNNNNGYKTAKSTFVKNKMSNPYGNINNAIALANALRESKGRAMQHLENGNYQAVADICFAGLNVSPKDEEFMMLLGQAYRLNGDKANALKWLKKASRLAPRDENLKSLVRKIESGEIEVNKPTSENNIPKKGKDRNTIQEISSLIQSGNYDEAIDIIDREVRNDEINILYGIRGIANYMKKNYGDAISDITKSANTVENISPNFLFYRAMAKSEVNDYYGAIRDYDVLIKNFKNNQSLELATLYNNKAYTLVKMEDYGEALKLVNQALDLDQNKWFIWDTRSEIYFGLKKYKNSIEDATKSLEIKVNANSYYIRGLSRINDNQENLGCQDLSRAGELGEKRAYDQIKKYCN